MALKRQISFDQIPGDALRFETEATTVRELLAERHVSATGWTIRVNDRIADLDTPLPDGDVVDVFLTQNNAGN